MPGSAASRLAKYTRKILKNTKEKSGNRISQFLALTLFPTAYFIPRSPYEKPLKGYFCQKLNIEGIEEL